eukprot:COSAG06_NODE_2724_length_6384_cov_81.190135_8_plen_250_part_01
MLTKLNLASDEAVVVQISSLKGADESWLVIQVWKLCFYCLIKLGKANDPITIRVNALEHGMPFAFIQPIEWMVLVNVPSSRVLLSPQSFLVFSHTFCRRRHLLPTIRTTGSVHCTKKLVHVNETVPVRVHGLHNNTQVCCIQTIQALKGCSQLSTINTAGTIPVNCREERWDISDYRTKEGSASRHGNSGVQMTDCAVQCFGRALSRSLQCSLTSCKFLLGSRRFPLLVLLTQLPLSSPHRPLGSAACTD